MEDGILTPCNVISDVIFFCRVWSDLDKISETGAE